MHPRHADHAKGVDIPSVLQGVSFAEFLSHKTKFWIDKWEFDPEIRAEAEAFLKNGGSVEAAKERFGGYIRRDFIDGNLLLNEGINAVWTLVAGGSETAYNNANTEIGVGDSTTAEAATQTDLQAATNKLFKAMDASFPTYGTSQKITFRATFGSSEANYAWQEFSVRNGNTANKNLNRKVSNQGTKTSGQTWQVTVEITLS
jgi:hypothetical protein